MATILSSLATLFVFAPLLVSLGENTHPPEYLAMLGKWWLLSMASVTATVHLGGAWLIGRPLVLLEVVNQSCEATFRRRLVLSEALPAGAIDIEDVSKNVSIEEIINTVQINYMRLFSNFLGLNFYLSIFDQVMVLVPYIVCAPLLFAAYDRRIELGILVQISNAFAKVFGALSVVAEDVAQIQDFRSTLHRLREFETKLRHSDRQSWSTGLMPVDEMRSDEAHCVVELTDQPLSKKNMCQ
jgi:peptide/bleomycin uptake transporter